MNFSLEESNNPYECQTVTIMSSADKLQKIDNLLQIKFDAYFSIPQIWM